MLRYNQLSAGSWFIHKERLHCRDSIPDRGQVLTFDLAGNFLTDSFCFYGHEMVEPVTVKITVVK